MLRGITAVAVPLAAATVVVGACALAPAPTPIVVYVTPAPTATLTATPRRILVGHISVADGGGAYAQSNSQPDAKYCLTRAKVPPGAEVLLLDQSKSTVGKGTLTYSDPKYVDGACQFDFVIANVLPAAFYSIQIGLHGGPTWSADELDAAGWVVTLSL